MYKEVLRSIEGIEIYPIISLLIFFAFFVGVGVWFFAADNWEMLIKVLDGCGLNQNYWVFAAATTNVEYTLTVTDTMTGQEVSYFNPLGQAASAITDTAAFATCP